MKADHMKNSLIGISVASAVIGLGLLGFASGVYLKTGFPIGAHALFDPAIDCLYAGLATILLLIIFSYRK